MNLIVNDFEIKLGMKLNYADLKTHKFKKPGLFSGIKKQPGQSIIWSKNCEIQCFGGEFLLFPNLDTNSGADMMYGTSAYLFFTNNTLELVTFQLVGNTIAANWIIDKFKEPATGLFGEPFTEGNKTSWGNTESNVVIEKIPGSVHAHFHWINKI